MICSAVLDSQLGLVVQSAAAGSAQPDAERHSRSLARGSPPAAGAPSLDLEEWLLSDVVWDPFDLVRKPPACARCLLCSARPA